ncbi:MAG: J domain-containing protein [Thermoguttaceae bacterium]|nr:J domain-containing protein [Thermoguttaceae bacterium]
MIVLYAIVGLISGLLFGYYFGEIGWIGGFVGGYFLSILLINIFYYKVSLKDFLFRQKGGMIVVYAFAGILTGQFLSKYLGELGWFGGFFGGLLFCIFLVDIFINKNAVKGFFRRQRGEILVLIFQVVGVILATKLVYDNIFMFLAGLYAGDIIGRWFLTQLHWDQQSDINLFNAKGDYLFILFQLFKLSNTNIESCKSEFLSIYQKVFAEEGFNDKVFDNLLVEFHNYPQSLTLPEVLNTISSDFQARVLLDYLRCIYSTSSVTQAQKDLGKEICNYYGRFHDILSLYDRSNTPAKTGKYYEALKTLGLTPSATQEEISSAYRNLIKQYHPDRLLNASDAIKEFAKQKTIEINAAYEILRDQEQYEDEDKEMVLAFLEAESDRLFLPNANETFICRCQLCLEKNRIQAGQDRKVARCRKCHALLGEER